MRASRVVMAAVAGLLLLPLMAGTAIAHPLGNFTINHHAGIRVEPDRVLLDMVIDQAEIPTFQATMDLDQDGDGELSADELADAARSECVSVGSSLALTVDAATAPLRLIEAGVSFPPGNGGLSTMRLVCTLESPFPATLARPVDITFTDGFEPTRIGWREIAVAGSGVTVSGTDLRATTTTGRLTSYPDTLASAPDVRSASFTATPGGATLRRFDVPDADPIEPVDLGADEGGLPAAPRPSAESPSADSPSAGASAGPEGTATATPRTAAGTTPGDGTRDATRDATGAVPGGEGAIPDILRTLPVTPALALLTLATAAILGAGHALTPGHGKTLMAAYLVGTRGTPRHAVGLGAAVSISHTVGILGLALVVVGAQAALPPDLVVRGAPVIAAITILGIGGWMLLTEARRWRRARVQPAASVVAAHSHHEASAHARAVRYSDGQPHTHDHEAKDDGLEHSHGGVTHRHVPAPGSTITWRSLFVLGLAGGLIPSTNALLILLATMAAGQPAWGVVLVVAFGMGMAGVMAGVGLAFVYARGLLERGASRAGVGRVARLVPFGAAVLVLAVGVVLTSQALSTAGLV